MTGTARKESLFRNGRSQAILVTDNVRAFSRIDGLAVENWLR